MSSPTKDTSSSANRANGRSRDLGDRTALRLRANRNSLNLAQLQSEVDDELDAQPAHETGKEIAMGEKLAQQTKEATCAAMQANDSGALQYQPTNGAGWYTNEWLPNILAMAKNMLTNEPMPTINLPVAPFVRPFGTPLIVEPTQVQPEPRASFQANKHWDEITMSEARQARSATDKNLESYSDEDGWEVVNRKDTDHVGEMKAQISRIDFTIRQCRAKFDALKMERVMMVEEMRDLYIKIVDLEKKRDKIKEELQEMGWANAELG